MQRSERKLGFKRRVTEAADQLRQDIYEAKQEIRASRGTHRDELVRWRYIHEVAIHRITLKHKYRSINSWENDEVWEVVPRDYFKH